MFLVGGGILMHGFHVFHDLELEILQILSINEGVVRVVVEQLYVMLLGLLIGFVLVAVFKNFVLIKKKIEA